MNRTDTMMYLADRVTIADTVIDFAYSIDTRDWPLFLSILAPQVEIVYPDSVGVGTFAATDLAEIAKSFFSRLDATQHVSANHRITIDGTAAVCTSTLLAQHYLASEVENPVQRQIGYYRNELEKTDRWRITRSEQRAGWMEGNMNVFLHATGAFE